MKVKVKDRVKIKVQFLQILELKIRIDTIVKNIWFWKGHGQKERKEPRIVANSSIDHPG